MLPDRVSNPGPLTYESGALPIALRCPARMGFSLLKQSQKSRSVLKDRLTFLGLFWEVKLLSNNRRNNAHA